MSRKIMREQIIKDGTDSSQKVLQQTLRGNMVYIVMIILIALLERNRPSTSSTLLSSLAHFRPTCLYISVAYISHQTEVRRCACGWCLVGGGRSERNESSE